MIVLIYLVGGQTLNYGLIFLMWSIYTHLCGEDYDMYNEVLKRNTSKGIGIFRYFDGWIRNLAVILLWPFNVYDTLIIIGSSIAEVRSRQKQAP